MMMAMQGFHEGTFSIRITEALLMHPLQAMVTDWQAGT
jgi:hypothetical protein